MGGHAAGEVASKMAVDQIKSFIASPTNPNGTSPSPSIPNEEKLQQAISYANQQIFSTASKDPALNGMGTTVVALLSTVEASAIGFVGDSRLYLLREGVIEQLTQDHSMVNDYVKKGLLSAEAAEHHPQKHVLSRALGTTPNVEVDAFTRKPALGDTYLLCSDGLSNKLSAAEMCMIVQGSSDLESAAKSLVQGAIAAGGEDNITVIMVSFVE